MHGQFIKKTRNYKLKQRLSHFISVMEVAVILKRPDLKPNILLFETLFTQIMNYMPVK